VFFLATGDSRIELVEYAPTGKPQIDNKASDTGSAHVCFKTENIEEVYQKLLATGVRLYCVPQDLGFAKVLYFRDPDGIILGAAKESSQGKKIYWCDCTRTRCWKAFLTKHSLQVMMQRWGGSTFA